MLNLSERILFLFKRIELKECLSTEKPNYINFWNCLPFLDKDLRLFQGKFQWHFGENFPLPGIRERARQSDQKRVDNLPN